MTQNKPLSQMFVYPLHAVLRNMERARGAKVRDCQQSIFFTNNNDVRGKLILDDTECFARAKIIYVRIR
jgi:hypothetical protein